MMDLHKFDENKIRREAYVYSYQFSAKTPIYTVNTLHKDVLRDQTKLLNSPTTPIKHPYFNLEWAMSHRPSSWNEYNNDK